MLAYLNKIKITSVLILITLAPLDFLFAQDSNLSPKSSNLGVVEGKEVSEAKKPVKRAKAADKAEPDFTRLQSEARAYRDQGLEFQRAGNIDAALIYYQKAVEIDPFYAVAYNDLGIIYEAKGLNDRAEENYLKAVSIDSSYLSACTNLALFYENKRDFNKAEFYWGKRAALGSPDDPWTEKAKMRLEDIRIVSTKPLPFKYEREQEVVDLLKEVSVKKTLLKNDNKALSREHFDKAKKSYERQDYPTAIKEALDAQYLDPDNLEIRNFIDKAQVRALSR